MLTEEQLALRKRGITSSDITRIVGESPWGNRCDVYADKIADVAQRPSTLYQRIGDFLEPLVCELIAEQFHVNLRASTTLVHPEHPWAMTTPDRTGKACVAEAKVKSVAFQRSDEWTEDEPPAFVTVQATWHCIVRRVPVCYVGALLGASPRFYVVERDETLADMLLAEADRFHREHVLARVPPAVDGSEGAKRMLAAAWPRNRGAMIRAGGPVEELASEYFALFAEAKRVDADLELRKQQLQSLIGEHDGIDGTGWRAFWKTREAVDIPATTRKSYRHWDMRKVGKGA